MTVLYKIKAYLQSFQIIGLWEVDLTLLSTQDFQQQAVKTMIVGTAVPTIIVGTTVSTMIEGRKISLDFFKQIFE